MSQKLDRGFRERKRQATSSRITAAAARLTLEHGLVATTVEQISEEAEIGRATFFRYFDSKERAVAEGLAGVWLQMIIDALSRQAPELGPLDAVRAAFSELARGFADFRELVLSQAQLSRSSPRSMPGLFWSIRATRKRSLRSSPPTLTTSLSMTCGHAWSARW